jgi:hypothetical protein
MRARIPLPMLLLTTLAALAWPRPVGAGPWVLAPGEWYSSLEGSAFSAPTFRNAGGGRVDSGLVVEQRGLRSYTELGWKHKTTFFLGLPALSVTRRDDGFQAPPPARRDAFPAVPATATGFQDALVGVRFGLVEGRTPVALELAWVVPMGYNRNLDTLGLQLGEGLQQLSLELHVGTSLRGRGFFQASAGRGLRYLGARGLLRAFQSSLYFVRREPDAALLSRPESERWAWSDLVLASADLGIWLGPSLLAAGRYRGTVTGAHGPLAPDVDVHVAGPLVLYRLDDRLDVFAGSWSTASGRNTLHFDQVYVGLAFHRTKLNRLQGYLGGKQAP